MSLNEREPMSALSNSIHVDTTTGKRSYQMTDQGALATLTDVIGGTAGGYASYAAKASNAAAVAQAANTTSETIKAAEIALATAQTAQNFALGGTAALSLLQSGAEFDSRGRYTGNWSLEGARGDSFLQSIATGAISAGISTAITKGFDIKSGYAQDIISSVSSVGVNTLSEYYKYQQGYQNNYAAITSPDIGNASAFWSLMTTMISRSNNSSTTDATSGKWNLDNALSGFKEGFLNQFTGWLSLGSLFVDSTEQVYSMVANLFGFARKREEELANIIENGESGAPTTRPPTDTERKAVLALLYSSKGPLETEKEIAKLERENVDISDIRKLVDTTRQTNSWRSLNDAEKQALKEFREEIGLNSILFKYGINIKLSKEDIKNYFASLFSKKIDTTNPFLTEEVIAALLADVQLEYNQWPKVLGDKHVRKAMQMVENDPSLMPNESVRDKFTHQRMDFIPIFDNDGNPVLDEHGRQKSLPPVAQGLCVVMGVYLMLKYEGANVGNFEDYYIQGINKGAIGYGPTFGGYVTGFIDSIVSQYKINGKEITAKFVNGNDLTEFMKSDARIITIRNAADTHTYLGYRTKNGDIYQADVGHSAKNGKPISVNDISSYRYLKLK